MSKHELCATPTLCHLTVGGFDHIFGMLLVKLAHGVGHLRLNPDTELHTVFLRCLKESVDAVRELAGVYHPIAER